MGIEILNTRILTYFDSDFLSLIKITWEIEFYCFIGASYRVANLKISGVNYTPFVLLSTFYSIFTIIFLLRESLVLRRNCRFMISN